MNPLKFSITPNSTPVTITNAEGAVTGEYVLGEMKASERDHYLDQLSNRMRLDATGKAVGIKKFEGMQADLIAACLKTKDGKPVPVEEIQAWPASIVSQLFKSAQELNHLQELQEDTSKNA